MKTEFKVGTRQSKLALVQTNLVVTALQAQFPAVQFTVEKITTQGDRNLTDSLQKIGGKGVFVKEIEQRLLNHQIDFAVHSLKDVTPVLPDGLIIGSVPKRDSPFDCLVSPKPLAKLTDLPQGARIGTNSLRRQGQLLHLRPDIEIIPIRGNVDSRLKKIASEHLDGVILAEAGLNRLKPDLTGLYRLPLQNVILPAAGQGAMAIECRQDDSDTLKVLAALDDPLTHQAVTVERDFMRRLGGSCNFPIGAYARPETDQLQFDGLVASADGKQFYSQGKLGPFSGHLGPTVAEQLIHRGALSAIS